MEWIRFESEMLLYVFRQVVRIQADSPGMEMELVGKMDPCA